MKRENEIEFYCKKCNKTLKTYYAITGDDNAPVLPSIRMCCHRRKCTRVMVMKNCTEGMVLSWVDKEGKVFI